MQVGQMYNPLPSHVTLMSRFWSDLSPDKLAETARPLFQETTPLELIFGETTKLGPKQVTAHMVAPSRELKGLHTKLRNLLDVAAVEYTSP